MSDPPQGGRITTFYSFKGGVGRTMALANVAFLAAMNGKRVLVMDWDLEAPGLAYYFRGMNETADPKAIRTTPGILNLVWDWIERIQHAESPEQVDALIDHYHSGAPFEGATRPLVDEEQLPNGGSIDVISAGSDRIKISDEVPYEEALARFSWPNFFDYAAGGVLLTALRDWSKKQYDHILIDSRTGFADVAGVCTMQLPDVVALCFVYNRQNIDGIAQVAGAVRAHRAGEVTLRAVPMRTSREDTNEEADAKGRARRELVQIGGFASADVEVDLKRLAIRAASNVPFYEVLSVIDAENPRGDPLPLNYAAVGSELLGMTLNIQPLDLDWVENVRRRSQPKHSTREYLLKLRSSEPERALQEVNQLVESALDEELERNGCLEDDYVRALVDTAIDVARKVGGPFDSMELLTRTLNLVRTLAASEPRKWKLLLNTSIEVYLETMAFYLDANEEVLLLDEQDGLLASSNTLATRVKRLNNRRRAARLHAMESDFDAVGQTLSEIQKLRSSLLKEKLNSEQMAGLKASEIDVYIVKGEHYLQQENHRKAYREYEKALASLLKRDFPSGSELTRFRFELHSRLARAHPDYYPSDKSARHALSSLECAEGSNSFVVQFIELGRAVIRNGDPELVSQFIERAFDEIDTRISPFFNYYSRNGRTAQRFIFLAAEFLELLVGLGDRAASSATILAELVAQIVRMLDRKSPRMVDRSAFNVEDALKLFISFYARIPGASEPMSQHLIQLETRLRDQRPARIRPRNS